MGFSVCLVAGSGETWHQQWSYVLTHWPPEIIYVLGDFDRRLNPYMGAVSIDSFDELPDRPIVVAAPKDGRYVKGREPLDTFVHPEDCIYVFGNDSSHFEAAPKETNHFIFVPTATHDEMYSFSAAAVIFYDRAVKRG